MILQLTPAPTDFKGPTIFICYKQISVNANIEIKEKNFLGEKIVSVTGGLSLEQDSSVYCIVIYYRKDAFKQMRLKPCHWTVH